MVACSWWHRILLRLSPSRKSSTIRGLLGSGGSVYHTWTHSWAPTTNWAVNPQFNANGIQCYDSNQKVRHVYVICMWHIHSGRELEDLTMTCRSTERLSNISLSKPTASCCHLPPIWKKQKWERKKMRRKYSRLMCLMSSFLLCSLLTEFIYQTVD